jgi:hypothetical protein
MRNYRDIGERGDREAKAMSQRLLCFQDIASHR